MSGPLAQSQRMGQMGHSSLCLLFLGSSMPPRPPDATTLPAPFQRLEAVIPRGGPGTWEVGHLSTDSLRPPSEALGTFPQVAEWCNPALRGALSVPAVCGGNWGSPQSPAVLWTGLASAH